MIEEIKKLNKKFINIKDKGFIKTMRDGPGGIGYTFEKSLGKEEENFPIPDYNGIEIKTSRKSSWGKIHLFHMTPDGDYLFPIKDIIKVLGYPDRDYPKYKVFNTSVNSKDYTKIDHHKKIKIKVNREKEKIYLIAKDENDNDYDLKISWSFDMLKKRIELKLKYLAIIKAETKRINGIEYFKYNKARYFHLKDFETFINLIEKGYINITFMVGIYKKGKKFGQTHDRGTAFTINEKLINYLYDEIILN